MPATPDRPAADALRASEARLRSILETAVDAFVSINAGGIVESFNPAAERMFGYRAAEVIGRNVAMLMPPPYRDEHDGYLHRYLATRERKIIGIGREAVGQRKDGSVFPIDLAVGEAIIDGKSVFTGVVRDLTERRRLEAKLLRAQRMELVGALAGGIAHDLNNVLAVVLTAAGNLQLDLSLDERRQVLDELTAAARRGTTVVRQIVSFARGVAPGSGPLRPAPLLNDLQHLLRHLLPRSIVLAVSIADDLPALVGNEAQLYQVLLNLCVNARDAMPHGGTLTLSATTEERDPAGATPGRFVVFSVADTGVGIPSDKIDAIFEPFYTTKPLGHGTGLGLATVRDLVRSHGGFVSATSEPGRGARFCVHWPATQPDGARAIAVPEGHGECVLIADGDRSAAELAHVALETYGYRAVVAHDAAEAAALFATHRDVIRVAVIDRAGPLEPAAVRVSAPEARLVGLGSGDGCDIALEKPYSATDLLRAVAAALQAGGTAI